MATTDAKKSDSSNSDAIVGFVVILLLFWGIYAGGTKIYQHFRPPPPPVKILLSAQLMPLTNDIAFLKIAGQAYQGGAPLVDCQAKILVEAADTDFSQTMLTTVSNGNFSVDGRLQPNLVFPAGSALGVTVNISDTKRDATPTSESAYINMSKPLLQLSTMWFWAFMLVVILVVIFLYTFVGTQTEEKNRWAIIFSYVVILIFLALPLVVPVALPYLFPNLIQLMVSRPTPVGLVVTKVEDRKIPEPQWALNIGGFVTATTNDDRQAGTTSGNDSSGVSQKIGRSADAIREVEVHGGLTIPLYVMILSILGGAINMTRKVPVYQSGMEKERIKPNFLLNMPRSIITSGLLGAQSLANIFGMKPALGIDTVKEPADASATKPEASATPGLPITTMSTAPSHKSVAELTLGKNEPQLSTEGWRIGLLGQYMSLISAPFLAIVTFCLLNWLNLQMVPILVIVSFSIGLMSDAIIIRITTTAADFLMGKNGGK
jgi:hypothetical protein